MAVFQYDQRVLFQHCDPAGIVFYPRYYEMINATVEHWFSDVLDCSFSKMHLEQKVAVPTVEMSTRFKRASFLEDELRFILQVEKRGDKSVVLSIDVYCEEECRLEATVTLVYVSIAEKKPKSRLWNDSLRHKIDLFMA